MYCENRSWIVIAVFFFFGCSDPYNFSPVVEGRLYRSNQPGIRGLNLMIHRYELKSVLYLDDDAVDQEEDFLKASGIRFHWVSLLGCNEETLLHKIAPLLRDESNYPMLVHCVSGADRTGRVIALYRFMFQGWSVDQALEEMRISMGGLKPGDPRCLEMIRAGVMSP